MEIKKFISIIIIIANIGLAKAQYTAIPDTCFEQHLIDLSIDTIGVLDGQVLTADIDSITELTMNGIDTNGNDYGCYIDNIQGINDFISLETLDFSINGVQYIDLSNLPNLKNLYCDDNFTQTLVLPPSIEIVYARFNRYNQNIDLSQTINLKELYIQGAYFSYQSHITSLDLSNCISLTKLDVAFNDLTSIDISTNALLKELTIAVNQIDTFIHNNNVILEHLQANNNNFTNIDVSNLIGLKFISIGVNEINSLDLSQNINLEKVGVSENNTITNLDLRNGHNNLITHLQSENTPNLTCIYVDNMQYSQNNWQEDNIYFRYDINNTFIETETECEALVINETIVENELIVYPNPVRNTLYIKNETISIDEIIIFNLLGKEVLKTNKSIIDFSTLKNGLYVIKIKANNNNIITKKIIKIGG